MIKVQVLFFGIATDLVGANSINIELNNNASVANFKKVLQAQYPKLSEINSYAIAVNESYAAEETILKEKDVLAIIPPVSGG